MRKRFTPRTNDSQEASKMEIPVWLFWLAVACGVVIGISCLIMLVILLIVHYMDWQGWRIYKDEEGNLVRTKVKRLKK